MGVDLEILGELKRIKEPETGVSIIDLGIVEKIVVKDGIYNIYVNFAYLNSSCVACMPILWMVVRSLVRKIERVLKEMNLRFRIIEAGRGEIHAQNF